MRASRGVEHELDSGGAGEKGGIECKIEVEGDTRLSDSSTDKNGRSEAFEELENKGNVSIGKGIWAKRSLGWGFEVRMVHRAQGWS